MEACLNPDASNSKRQKVRSAWISFAGRIAAQLIGAIATVTLGVIVLGGRQAPPSAPPPAVAAPASTVLVATPIRTHGETVIVVLPLGQDGQVNRALATEVANSVLSTKMAPVAARQDVQRRTPTDPPAPLSADPSADSRASLATPHE